jgi:hypothetical protein
MAKTIENQQSKRKLELYLQITTPACQVNCKSYLGLKYSMLHKEAFMKAA